MRLSHDDLQYYAERDRRDEQLEPRDLRTTVRIRARRSYLAGRAQLVDNLIAAGRSER